MNNTITSIAFDADDTLWLNEPYFQEAEQSFCELMEDYLPQDSVSKELFATEMKNLRLYGYGIKGFILCMIETAGIISGKRVSFDLIERIIAIGHELLEKPVELLPGVPEVLEKLQKNYQLVVATKGDLLDQERKLEKSGLAHYFHHIEIMSDKKQKDYEKLARHLNCLPENFLMIGNSIKSDILPVLDMGGHGAYIPYHITWAHEQHDNKLVHPNFIQLQQLEEIFTHF